MVKGNVVCIDVQDGNTFRTDTQIWIRLARVNTQRLGAQKMLKSLIYHKNIYYESVSIDTNGRIVAEVWLDDININDYMRAQGYS